MFLLQFCVRNAQFWRRIKYKYVFNCFYIFTSFCRRTKHTCGICV